MSVQASGIRILEDRVVDQIAAGEVVDRPASVVKELVENAIDAQASLIEVVLQDGGRGLISVADNGCGMGEQDALLAIERHATSKIEGIDDLVGIRSFGFRGEALPSIAAVSKFELLTRRPQDEDGTRVRINGGTLADVRPAGAAVGTHIRVRQLFYNLPARRAFLRQPSTELGHCVQCVTRMALARPGIGFSLQHAGRHLVNAPVADTLAQRAIDVLGADARRLVEVRAEAGGLRLSGLVSPPHVHRSTGNGAIYSYVNGRWVRDLVLRRAIQQAYRDLTPRGRYPIVVLHLELDGNGVDVNVHPSKAEVQFRDPASVGSFVAQSLRHVVLAQPGQQSRRPLHVPNAVVPPLPFREATLPDDAPRAAPPPVLPQVAVAPVVADALLDHTPEPPPPPAATQAEPESPSAEEEVEPELFTVVGGRFAVGRQGPNLWLLDVGRLARRVECLRVRGTGKPLLVPEVLTWKEIDVRAAEYYAEELSAAGIEAVKFSPIELAVRAVPEAVRGCAVNEVLTIALQAARRNSPVVTALGSRLPPLPVPDDLSAVRAIIDAAKAEGLVVAPRVVDPLVITRGVG